MTRPDEIKQNFMGHVVKNLLEYFALLLADFQYRLPHEIGFFISLGCFGLIHQ
jgi:hypothetical protein